MIPYKDTFCLRVSVVVLKIIDGTVVARPTILRGIRIYEVVFVNLSFLVMLNHLKLSILAKHNRVDRITRRLNIDVSEKSDLIVAISPHVLSKQHPASTVAAVSDDSQVAFKFAFLDCLQELNKRERFAVIRAPVTASLAILERFSSMTAPEVAQPPVSCQLCLM